MRIRNLRIILLFSITSYILIYIYTKIRLIDSKKDTKKLRQIKIFNSKFEYKNSIRLKSYCSECRPDIFVQRLNISTHQNINIYYSDVDDETLIYYPNDYSPESIEPNLIQNKVIYNNPKFTCDLYNVLKHGPKQKVLSYCLYGRHYPYYDHIWKIAQTAQKIYPDWIIRVYYDKSINKSIICDLECKYENIYFCDVNNLPKHDQQDLFRLVKKKQEKNIYKDFEYIHAMMWRWFPIADDFIDYFASRDTDSTLIQREKDSVDVWLKEEKLFHVMRDNPYHNIYILGGLWGHANVLNRSNGFRIFNHFIKPSVQDQFNPSKQHSKNSDQNYLTLHVWEFAQTNVTMHDAYNCKIFGGKPFPTRRPTDMYCFVSCFNPCCDLIHNQSHRMPTCPNECRPKDHQDWDTC